MRECDFFDKSVNFHSKSTFDGSNQLFFQGFGGVIKLTDIDWSPQKKVCYVAHNFEKLAINKNFLFLTCPKNPLGCSLPTKIP